jgi:mono/diheme cytochrome c family protein
MKKCTCLWAMSFLLALLLISFAIAQQPEKPAKPPMSRGEYLVTVSGCHDCHSPKVFTPKGPMPDMTKPLSGAPAEAKLPDVPKGSIAPDKWGALTTNDLTAWAGPWGVSYAFNLTPDKETGLGYWKAETFKAAMRTGKHQGTGRDILPPMPWFNYALMTDADLDAIFAYLQTLKPIKNAVPVPLSPLDIGVAPPGKP